MGLWDDARWIPATPSAWVTMSKPLIVAVPSGRRQQRGEHADERGPSPPPFGPRSPKISPASTAKLIPADGRVNSPKALDDVADVDRQHQRASHQVDVGGHAVPRAGDPWFVDAQSHLEGLDGRA